MPAHDPSKCLELAEWAKNLANAPGPGDELNVRPKLREIAEQLEWAAKEVAEIGSNRFDSEVLAESRRNEITELQEQLRASRTLAESRLSGKSWFRQRVAALEQELAEAREQVAPLEAQERICTLQILVDDLTSTIVAIFPAYSSAIDANRADRCADDDDRLRTAINKARETIRNRPEIAAMLSKVSKLC